jgi:hypothetical protein
MIVQLHSMQLWEEVSCDFLRFMASSIETAVSFERMAHRSREDALYSGRLLVLFTLQMRAVQLQLEPPERL